MMTRIQQKKIMVDVMMKLNSWLLKKWNVGKFWSFDMDTIGVIVKVVGMELWFGWLRNRYPGEKRSGIAHITTVQTVWREELTSADTML